MGPARTQPLLDGTSAVNPCVPLEFLTAGEEGTIQQIDGSHDLVVRLAEMGFRQGVGVRMVKPGSPCILALNNHRISFRCDQTVVILVEVSRSPSPL